MYMMEKLDALKQEIGKDDAVRQWEMERWGKTNRRPRQDALLEYAHEMLKIHDDLKKYCYALTAEVRKAQGRVDECVKIARELADKTEKLNAKYERLRKKTAPKKTTATKRVAKPKGT